MRKYKYIFIYIIHINIQYTCISFGKYINVYMFLNKSMALLFAGF